MNILTFSWRGPKHPNAGGAEESTHQHAKGWVKAGHNVTLFTSDFVGATKEEVVDGVKIIRRGRQVLGVQWEAFWWYLSNRHPKYDLVVDQFHGIPFFTPLYVRTNKLAFIHEVTKEVWKYNPWPKPFNLIPSILGTYIEPLIIKFLYEGIKFMTVSESTKNDLLEWGIKSGNIKVIHNGINFFGTPLAEREKKTTVMFLGALSKDKGIEDTLKTFSILHKNHSDWQFWVVGKSDLAYLQYLKSLSKGLGIDRYLKFWGFVDEEKKFKLLAKAHLLVNQSVREGWGLVVIEAAAVGTPTVGYNVPGLKDSIADGKTGVLCESTPEACAREVEKLVADTKKYKVFVKNCLDWAKTFTWQKSVKESLLLLQSLISKT